MFAKFFGSLAVIFGPALLAGASQLAWHPLLADDRIYCRVAATIAGLIAVGALGGLVLGIRHRSRVALLAAVWLNGGFSADLLMIPPWHLRVEQAALLALCLCWTFLCLALAPRGVFVLYSEV